MRTATITELEAHIDTVEQLLATEPDTDGMDWKEAHAARKAWRDKIAEDIRMLAGGMCGEDWQGAFVRIGGIRSTSTTGLDGALRNWLKAGIKRVAGTRS